ncbi:MAG: hypothetical protein WD894_17030 [Pirellulales bacterium]
MVDIPRPMFSLGQTVVTPGTAEALQDARQTADEFIRRHVRGDWGDVDSEDAETNERALKEGARIVSVYHTTKGVKVCVITEADRSSTCILLPEEY